MSGEGLVLPVLESTGAHVEQVVAVGAPVACNCVRLWVQVGYLHLYDLDRLREVLNELGSLVDEHEQQQQQQQA